MDRYDPSVALIVVDVQNDFADPSGALAVAGAERILPHVRRETEVARASGALVVHTQDWHPPRTPHFDIDGGTWPVHCVAGTWGAELHPALGARPDPAGLVIRKGSNGEDGYSAFTMRDPASGATVPTELEARLRARDIARVAVCGLATDYCVRATALDAIRLGFPTILLVDAVAAVDLRDGDGDRAIAEMAAAGVELARTAGPDAG